MTKTATIQLKPEFTERIEIGVGNVAIIAEPGKPVKVPILSLDAFLRRGIFDHIDPAEEPVSETVDSLVKLKKEDLIKRADELGIGSANLSKNELAELIVQKLEEK